MDVTEEQWLVVSQTHSPGVCPDHESNGRLFTLQNDTQPTESRQSGHSLYILNFIFLNFARAFDFLLFFSLNVSFLFYLYFLLYYSFYVYIY